MRKLFVFALTCAACSGPMEPPVAGGTLSEHARLVREGDARRDANDFEAAAYAYLSAMHARRGAEVGVADERLHALEANPNAVDAVDRAAVRFLRGLTLAPDMTDDAVMFLGDRGFEPEDRALPRRPALVPDVETAAFAHLAGPDNSLNRDRTPICLGHLDESAVAPDVVARVAAHAPPARACARRLWDDEERKGDGDVSITHAIGRVRWVGEHQVKVEVTSRRAHSSCAHGYVLVLRESSGGWEVIRTIFTWIS